MNDPAILSAPGRRRHRGPFYVVNDAGCWVWQHGIASGGYGSLSISGKNVWAHRWVYEQLVGPIPEGLNLDHTCHDPETCVSGDACPHRRCVNPAHLEAVTQAENVRRGARRILPTHCGRGHEYTEVDSRGNRMCPTCIHLKRAERGARRTQCPHCGIEMSVSSLRLHLKKFHPEFLRAIDLAPADEPHRARPRASSTGAQPRGVAAV